MQSFLLGNKEHAPKPKPKEEQTVSKPVPWVEKYRPRTIKDVAYQDEVVSVLQKTLEGADLPNLLFYGPPGTGKTSTILALGRQMFGDMYKSRILELNASDERGIQVVREKIKNFSQQSAVAKPNCPPFKIVILDEADSMTHQAQAALRRTMELYTKSTRFCLICNYVSRIIEPLTSRCSKFRFKPLLPAILQERLKLICEKEDLDCSEQVLSSLIDISEGDLRQAITLLQSVKRLKPEGGLTEEELAEIAGVIPQVWLIKFTEVCETDSYEQLDSFIQDMLLDGYSAGQFIKQYHDQIVLSHVHTDRQKAAICEKLAICEQRLLEGADELLQLLDVGCTVMKELCQDNI